MSVPGAPDPDPVPTDSEPPAVPPTLSRQPDPPDAAEALPEAETAPDGTSFERPHPLTPLIRGWLVLVAILFFVGRELIPDGDGSTIVQDLSESLPYLLLGVGAVVLAAAVGGFVSWRFTRFVIDDDELRVETGAIFRQSKRIPFQRLQSIDIVQPLAARIFGLAELRLEAGAGDSGARLRYLGRTKATRLRDYLMTRAAGEQRSIAEASGDTSAWTDLGVQDEVLVRLPPRQLVVGFLLSAEFLIPVVLVAVGLSVTTVFGVVLFALPGLIPLAIGLVTTVSRQLIAQFNYTLSRSGRGLRISRGLTNLTSQSVPVDRIQGINITQGISWRPLGYHRVRIDVLGQKGGSDESGTPSADSLLLPVATWPQVQVALRAIMPDVDLTAIELRPSPRSARWLRWWQWWTLRHGWDDRVVVTRRGWLSSSTDVVPHTKTQSVRITRGPAQRRLGLATVHVDNTPGPVTLQMLHLATEDARTVAIEQLHRMQRARTLAAADPVPSATDPVQRPEPPPPEPSSTP